MTRDLRLATWNVHRGRGGDGRVDPVRTADALLAEVVGPGGPDVLSLQEADTETPPHAGLLDIPRIEAESGLRSVHTRADLRWGAQSHGFLGVLLFLGPRLELRHAEVLDLPGRCHRGAVVAEVRTQDAVLRFVATHLSLGQPARIAQLRTIGQYIFRRPAMPTVLLGDLNEWRPWSGLALSPALLGARFRGPVPATFPVRRPFLPLDRILAAGDADVIDARVLDGPGIRAASDHRPLVARLRLGAGGG